MTTNRATHFSGNFQVLKKGSVKNILSAPDLNDDELLFEFSDRYSIFDWGEMPDPIPHKGYFLTQMAIRFFELLEAHNIATCYKGYVPVESITTSENTGPQSKVPEKPKSLLKVRKFLVPTIADRNYEAYQTPVVETLVPLEVIFRLGAPAGSSYLTRNHLSEPQWFSKPIVEFSTKLEPRDRYLSDEEAQKISGMSDNELKELKKVTLKIAEHLKLIFARYQIELWDGKFEFGFARSNNETLRSFVLVDSIGIDELRLQYKDLRLSKELLRSFYRNGKWERTLRTAKKKYGDAFKQEMLASNLRPPPLSSKQIQLAADVYRVILDLLNNLPENKINQELEALHARYLEIREEQVSYQKTTKQESPL